MFGASHNVWYEVNYQMLVEGIKMTLTLGAKEMVYWVKCLLCKHEFQTLSIQ